MATSMPYRLVVVLLLTSVGVSHRTLEAVEIGLKSGEQFDVEQVEPGTDDRVILSTSNGSVEISVLEIETIAGKPYTFFATEDDMLEKMRKELMESLESRAALLTPEGEPDMVTRRKCYFVATLLARVVLDTDQWELVRPFHTWLESVAQTYPRDWCARTCLGHFYARAEKNWNKAATYFEEVLALDSSPAVLHAIGVDLGQVYIERRENAKAEEISQKVLQAYPDALKARFNLGASLINQERFEEGLREFRAIISASPGSPEAERSRAVIEAVENALRSENTKTEAELAN